MCCEKPLDNFELGHSGSVPSQQCGEAAIGGQSGSRGNGYCRSSTTTKKDRDLSKGRWERVSSWEGVILRRWIGLLEWTVHIYTYIYSKCIKNVEHSELRKGQGFKRMGFLLPLLGQNYRANSSLITWHLQLIFPRENLAFHPSFPFLTESLS